jgi:hypothetical protein
MSADSSLPVDVPISGPWNDEEAERWLLDSVIPLRLAVPTRSGFPMLLSLWYLYENGCLWCAVHRSAKVYRAIQRNGRCSFEVAPNEPPYRGVRGRGLVSIVPDEGERVLRALIDRFLGKDYPRLSSWLLSRAADEVALRLDPVRLSTWDYTRRMSRDD